MVAVSLKNDRDASPVNNQQRDLDTHVGSHMLLDDLIGWTTMSRIQSIRIQFPLSIGMLFARDSIVGIPIPSSILLPASHFTRAVMHDPVINHLITLSSLWWCITEWAQRYLSVIRSDKSQSRFVPIQHTLSEIPVMYLYSHPVMLWHLAHPRQSYGIRELHNLMV